MDKCSNVVYVVTQPGPNYTVGKYTPCKLSFVYMSYTKYGVRAAPKFGNHASLFSHHKIKIYV